MEDFLGGVASVSHQSFYAILDLCVREPVLLEKDSETWVFQKVNHNEVSAGEKMS
jgi:hypothetical protein